MIKGAGEGSNSKTSKLSVGQMISSQKLTSQLQDELEEKKKKAIELQAQKYREFKAKSSMYLIIKYLYEDCLKAVTMTSCLICNKKIIPSKKIKILNIIKIKIR